MLFTCLYCITHTLHHLQYIERYPVSMPMLYGATRMVLPCSAFARHPQRALYYAVWRYTDFRVPINPTGNSTGNVNLTTRQIGSLAQLIRFAPVSERRVFHWHAMVQRNQQEDHTITEQISRNWPRTRKQMSGLTRRKSENCWKTPETWHSVFENNRLDVCVDSGQEIDLREVIFSVRSGPQRAGVYHVGIILRKTEMPICYKFARNQSGVVHFQAHDLLRSDWSIRLATTCPLWSTIQRVFRCDISDVNSFVSWLY